MTIPASARPMTPGAPNQRVAIVDPQTGNLSSSGVGILTDMYNFFVGTSRVIPCEETGTNVLVLTMLKISPLINQYNDYDIYQFVAAATSTGTVTANIVTLQGALPTLNVYKSNGAAQATTGDIVLGSFYLLIYVDSLNSGAGGFVLK